MTIFAPSKKWGVDGLTSASPHWVGLGSMPDMTLINRFRFPLPPRARLVAATRMKVQSDEGKQFLDTCLREALQL